MSIGNALALIAASYIRLLVPWAVALTVIHHRRAVVAENHWPSFSAAIQMRTYSGQLTISGPAASTPARNRAAP
jgi:hypothetical protein